MKLIDAHKLETHYVKTSIDTELEVYLLPTVAEADEVDAVPVEFIKDLSIDGSVNVDDLIHFWNEYKNGQRRD